MPLDTHQKGSNQKEMTSVGKGAKTAESLYVADGNLKRYIGKTSLAQES